MGSPLMFINSRNSKSSASVNPAAISVAEGSAGLYMISEMTRFAADAGVAETMKAAALRALHSPICKARAFTSE